MTTSDTWNEDYLARREGELNRTRRWLREICNSLKELGVTSVRVEYHGSGDEGFIESIEYQPEKVAVDEEVTNSLDEAVCDFLPSGWEVNDGAFGTLVIDTLTHRVQHEHNENFTDDETTVENIDLNEENDE